MGVSAFWSIDLTTLFVFPSSGHESGASADFSLSCISFTVINWKEFPRLQIGYKMDKKKIEKDHIKRFNHERNLEREKRKLEWKKLNVIAKDKEKDERLKQIK